MRLTAGVISVCPPIISTLSEAASSAACRTMSCSTSSVVPSGASIVNKSPKGSTPLAATSLQDMCTARRPISLEAPVIGSVDTTQAYSPKSSTLQSSPTFDLTSTSFLLNRKLDSILFSSTSDGSLPLFMTYPLFALCNVTPRYDYTLFGPPQKVLFHSSTVITLWSDTMAMY